MKTLTAQDAFRRAMSALALLLALQFVWLLLAQMSRPDIDHLPTDAETAGLAAKQRSDATWAAWVGVIRGDLWAQSAYTFADLLWTNSDLSPSDTANARSKLDSALAYAPHQADAWLLLAGLVSRSGGSNQEATEALKVAFYTAPSDLRLIPLRLRIAAASGATTNPEVDQFLRRDVRILMAHERLQSVVDSYRTATPDAQRIIQEAMKDIDPRYPAYLKEALQSR
jgi:hypothetical protein